MIKVIMVDDDRLILQSLKITLKKEKDFNVLNTFTDGNLAVEFLKSTSCDLVLLDIQMPAITGIETAKLIRTFSDVPIMMLTTFADKEHIKDALAAGANGYLLKTDPMSQLAPKLRLLTAGTGVMSSDALKALTTTGISPLLEELTPREQDIVKLVGEGLTNKEIAATLYLSEGTVRNRLVPVMEKLNVKNRNQLAALIKK